LSTLEIALLIALLLFVFTTFKRYKLFSINLIFFIIGFIWMGVFSKLILHPDIDEKFFNKPISVVGTIHTLPQKSSQKSSLNFQVSEPFLGKT